MGGKFAAQLARGFLLFVVNRIIVDSYLVDITVSADQSLAGTSQPFGRVFRRGGIELCKMGVSRDAKSASQDGPSLVGVPAG